MLGDQRLSLPGVPEHWEGLAGLRSAMEVVSQRETDTGATVHSRYYISSLAAPAEQMLRWRGHTGVGDCWQIGGL